MPTGSPLTQDADLQARISELVTRVILESTGRDLTLGVEEPLISSGFLDSMSMVNLVIAMQSELGVELDVTHMNAENFESIRAIAELVEARRASTKGGDARLANSD